MGQFIEDQTFGYEVQANKNNPVNAGLFLLRESGNRTRPLFIFCKCAKFYPVLIIFQFSGETYEEMGDWHYVSNISLRY